MREIKFDFLKVWPPRHHNPSDAAQLKTGEVLLLSSGTKDEVHIYRDDDHVWVLSYNVGLNYVGVREYNLDKGPRKMLPLYKLPDGSRPEPMPNIEVVEPYEEDVFMDRDYDIEHAFGGRDLGDLRPRQILDIMMEYLQ